MALALQIGMKSLRNEFDEAHQLELQIATSPSHMKTLQRVQLFMAFRICFDNVYWFTCH